MALTSAPDCLSSRLFRRIAALAAATSRPKAVEDELLTVFRSSLETHRARLRVAREAGDVAEARSAAHALLGPSGYLRATELEACCRTLEALGDPDADAWHRAVVAVDTGVDAVLRALAERDRPPGAPGA